MNVAAVISALGLPAQTRVEQRVPKKLLVENGAPTAADMRQIETGIEELFWWAALKPTTIGVPEYRDEVREYLEIAVLSLTLRADATGDRLIELVHRAVPYPVFLITQQQTAVSLSLAHKRHSQNEAGRVVLDETATVCPLGLPAAHPEFLASLALTALPKSNLSALYQGWLAALDRLRAASVTGHFAPPAAGDESAALREALAAHSHLTREIAALRAAAAKEKQTNRRVDLNLKVKRLEADLAVAIAALTPEH